MTEGSKSYPIREAFRRFLPGYLKRHSVSSQQYKTAVCISKCKTGELGYNISYCENCGYQEIHACSCNNRHCPCCQAPVEQAWIQSRNSELIKGVAYYHTVFTVPMELNDLIYENQTLLYNLMFRCSSDTLITLCRDKKYMGATPGIVSVLHTQGSRLNYHPHIHTMLSGGGLTADGKFIESAHKGYLLPKAVMGKLFRGKFLEKLKMFREEGKLLFIGRAAPLKNSYAWKEFLDTMYKKDWIPFIKETFNGKGNAVKYLARYVFRSAISNNRINSVDETGVTFHYKDYSDNAAIKQHHMTGDDFIGAFLMHVLPRGFCRVRFSGYLSNCRKTKNLKRIHSLRDTVYEGDPLRGKSMAEWMRLLYDRDICSCPKCQSHMLRLPRGMPLIAAEYVL